MPRPLVIGNGEMLVTFDADLNMRDLYYPYVGQWNHIGGHKGRTGIWVGGQYAWLDDPAWEKSLGYRHDTLVTHVVARHATLGLELEISDAVHYRDPLYLRRLVVRNLADTGREVRLFFAQDFSLQETEVGDTALYDPDLGVLFHYKRDTYLLCSGMAGEGGLHQYACGKKRFQGAEGTWRDAEDGVLGGNPIAQGSVDSVVGLTLLVPPNATATAWFWIIAGPNFGEVSRLEQYVRQRTPAHLLGQIDGYWRQWLSRTRVDPDLVTHRVADLYRRSLLVVRTQVDRRGAFVAANDTDIMDFNLDHYSYCWPRDGALVAQALIGAGFADLAVPFFQFCAQAVTEQGYLLQKYNPDGSAGSSWHARFQAGRRQLPIQEDETALVLIALWDYYEKTGDIELVTALKKTLIERTAHFLAAYVHPHLDLPQESFDLWEERRGIFAWTTGAVVGALRCAAKLERLFSDEKRAQNFDAAADRIARGASQHLYDPELRRFVRGIYVGADGHITRDPVVDSSLYGLAAWGCIPLHDPRLAATMEAMERDLWVNTPVGGLARYQGDYYHRVSDDIKRVPGNPWFVTTLWLAEWYIDVATCAADLGRAAELLEWAAGQALFSGVLPEQLDPFNGAPLSVAPLTWSHAAFIRVVDRLQAALQRLERGERAELLTWASLGELP